MESRQQTKKDQGVQENTHERRPQVRLRGARDGGQVSRPHAEMAQVLEKHPLARTVEGAIAHASLQIPADPRDNSVHSEETRRVLQQRRLFFRGQTERDQLVHTYFTEPRALSEAAVRKHMGKVEVAVEPKGQLSRRAALGTNDRATDQQTNVLRAPLYAVLSRLEAEPTVDGKTEKPNGQEGGEEQEIGCEIY